MAKKTDEWKQHVLEDFRNRFISSLNDYLSNMKLQVWKDNAMGPLKFEYNKEEVQKSTARKIHID